MLQEGEKQDLDPQSRREINALQSRLMGMGRRVLAFAKFDLPPGMVPDGSEFNGDCKNFPMGADLEDPGREGHLESLEDKPDMLEGFERLAHLKLTFLGMIALIDPPRPAVPDAAGSHATGLTTGC